VREQWHEGKADASWQKGGEMHVLARHRGGVVAGRWLVALLVGTALAVTTVLAQPALASSTVAAWGSNIEGGLGDGLGGTKGDPAAGPEFCESFFSCSKIPVVVNGLSGVRALSAGNERGVALLSDGTVKDWGWGAYGQLGDGSGTGPETCNGMPCSRTPIAVSGLSGVAAISAGNNHSLALLNDGTVVAWGANRYGQLGNGTTNESNVPVAVSGLEGVRAISAGGERSIALLSDGTVVAWGGVTGPDTCFNKASCSTTPQAVKGLESVTAISAGGGHDLALLTDGTVMAWGFNRFGQLGNGTTVSSEVPSKVSGLSAVIAVSGESEDSYALLGDGTVKAWGADGSGELGTGSPAPETCSLFGTTSPCATTPVAVSGLTGVTAISGREALLSNGTVMDWGSNRHGELGDDSVTGSDVPVRVSGLNEVTGIAGVYAIAPSPVFTTVTKVAPATGPVGGGTVVKITGTNFTGATAVRFGASSAVSFTVNSATSINAIAPAEAAGAVDVTVNTPVGGTSLISTHDRFRFAPTVTGVSPNLGPSAGGTSLTITGTGFALGTTGTSFKLGTTKAGSVNCTSSTACTLISPAHSVGKVDVRALVKKVISAKTPGDQFTYN
jgi:alpha-tubulin suppressor-like RCC1 family protein